MSGDEGKTDDETGPTKPSTGSGVTSGTHQIDLGSDRIAQPDFERYEIGDMLGAGGMGEVRVCRDRGIGRRVAMKVLRSRYSERQGFQTRFLREARVQGQLEHPCVVPVYEVGLTPDGEPYFTMKRVKGTTLRKVLQRLRDEDEATEATYTRRKLLTAFSTVCLAVDAAHRGGVVHRDIKPGNIMFGDFGEVYLLDWGIASLAGEPDDIYERIEDPESDGLTRAGAVLGTPKYMAPEQAEGSVDARSDVFALGAVLYEILTLQSLFESSSSSEDDPTVPLSEQQAVTKGLDEQLLPPELIAMCRRASAADPDLRYQDARALQIAIDRYLDGDRDLELRKTKAAELAERAAEKAQRALGQTEATADRVGALRDAGQALGLDPSNARALEVVATLLTAPPAQMPEQARAEFESDYQQTVQRSIHMAGFVFLAPIALYALALWAGVRSWTAFAVSIATFGAVSLLCFWIAGRRYVGWSWTLVMATGLAAVATASYCFGPFVVVPTVVIGLTIGAVMYFPFTNRFQHGVLGSLAIMVPTLLDWFGVLPPAYEFSDAGILILPRLADFPEIPITVALVILHLSCVWICVYFFGWYRDQLGRSEQRSHLQSWQLRQLLPDGASRQLMLDDPAVETSADELASGP